jgi:hypothetical protein
VCLDRLEAAGAKRGRPRAVQETTREFASALGHPRLPAAVAVLEAELFSGRPVTEDGRRLAEAVVDEVVDEVVAAGSSQAGST